MLRWSTAAATCLLLGAGVKGAVVAASEAGEARGDGERRSLMATNEQQGKKMLFDFTDPKIFGEEEAASWWESSDTVRSAGMSKAVFSLQRSVRFQRAVFFAMINPQVVLTDSDQVGLPLVYTYEHKFPLNSLNNREMEEVHLPLTEFAAFFRGQQVEDAPPLDLTKIGAFGLQTFGGVYDDFKQSGVGTLEIDSISLY